MFFLCSRKSQLPIRELDKNLLDFGKCIKNLLNLNLECKLH